MSLVRWTVRWGDSVIATGTGRLPPEYGLPQPRVTHGDRAVVRNGNLSAEAVRVPAPPRASRWGVPDLHFAKVLTLCLMTFAAMMVLVRERIAELKLASIERPEETDIFHPLPARWVGHAGFTHSSKHDTVLASKDLARIKGIGSKVKDLEHRKQLQDLLAPIGAVATLTSSRGELSDVFARVDREAESNVFGGLTGTSDVGGFGSGSGLGGGAVVGVGVGGLGTRGEGSGSGYGGGGGAIGIGSLSGYSGRPSDSRPRVGLSTADEHRRVLSRVRGRVADCLANFEGSLVTELELFDDGRVKSVTATNASASVQRCVSRVLEPLQFAPGTEDVRATWTVD